MKLSPKTKTRVDDKMSTLWLKLDVAVKDSDLFQYSMIVDIYSILKDIIEDREEADK